MRGGPLDRKQTRGLVATITQVELGVRYHRHRTLESLSIQATGVMATLRHAGGSVIPPNLSERPPDRPSVPAPTEVR
jgi:hypothetical protein